MGQALPHHWPRHSPIGQIILCFLVGSARPSCRRIDYLIQSPLRPLLPPPSLSRLSVVMETVVARLPLSPGVSPSFVSRLGILQLLYWLAAGPEKPGNLPLQTFLLRYNLPLALLVTERTLAKGAIAESTVMPRPVTWNRMQPSKSSVSSTQTYIRRPDSRPSPPFVIAQFFVAIILF